MPEREYDVEEANALLPTLAQTLTEIREARQIVLDGAERLQRSADLDGGGTFSQEYWDALAALRRHIESLSDQGIVLRDPETGLIDFPSRREGQLVFLCWRLGEERVEFWHGPESGFAGRRPL
jgi:hypothetical protein